MDDMNKYKDITFSVDMNTKADTFEASMNFGNKLQEFHRECTRAFDTMCLEHLKKLCQVYGYALVPLGIDGQMKLHEYATKLGYDLVRRGEKDADDTM